MALKLGELKYLLSMDPKNFLVALEKVSLELEKTQKELDKTQKKLDETQKKAGKPLKFKADVKNLVDSLGKVGLAFNGIREITQSIQGPLAEVNRVFLEQEKSLRKIDAASKLTGVSLTELKNISKRIQGEFKLTTQQANDFVVAANKLTSAAGETGKTGEALKRLFDLAAGQGLNASEALLRFDQAIKGIDEGTEALFSGKNPIDLYQEWSKQIGVSVGKMNDQQKKQAILNAILRDGTTLQGSYNKFLQDAAGKQSIAANQAAELKAELGKLFNEVYIPILEVATPFLKFLTDMGAGTRNATIATAAFLAVAVKTPAILKAIRIGLVALQGSLGPAGLLMIGLGAAATALGVYAASAEDAQEANKDLAASNKSLAKTFNNVSKAVEKAYGKTNLKELVKLQAFFSKKIEESRKKLDQLNKAREAGENISEQELANAEFFVRINQQRLEAIKQLIQRRKSLFTEAEENITKKQFDEERKRQEFLFKSNRITTAQYLEYLQGRKKLAAKFLGEESIEYLKHLDKIDQAHKQFFAELEKALGEAAAKLQLKIRDTTSSSHQESLDKSERDRKEEFFKEAMKMETEFNVSSMERLNEQFEDRKAVLDRSVEISKELYGLESEEYRKALFQREKLDIGYEKNRKTLMKLGAQAFIDTGAQLLTIFQGQSRSMFEIGKALSIAQATINAYQSASEAYKTYPYPFNLAVAALMLAKGFGQVANIKKTKFKTKGFRLGGLISEGDLLKSAISPPGEDGLIAVQAGEMIMNRDATRRFAPVLSAMNAGRVAGVRGFQEGGIVGEDTQEVEIINSDNGIPDIIEAIRDIKIINQYEVEADFVNILRKNIPKYEKLERELTL